LKHSQLQSLLLIGVNDDDVDNADDDHDDNQNEYKHSLTFRVRRYTHLQHKGPFKLTYVYVVNVIAPIANPPNTAQLEGTLYQSPKLHPGPCSSVGMRRGTDR